MYRDKRDNKRKYMPLRKGWTDVLYDAIWEQLRLPCAYTFKKGSVPENPGAPYLKITAACYECHSSFVAHTVFKPNDVAEGIILQVCTSDTCGIRHVKKRRLASELCTNIGQELVLKKAATWQRDKANRCMKFGEPELANMYSKEVSRKVKQEIHDAALIGGQCTDIVKSINNLQDY